MTRALTMEEAAETLGVGYASLREIVSEHPFYYPNGRRKLFAEDDISILRHFVSKMPSASDALVRFIATKLDTQSVRAAAKLLGNEQSLVYVVRCESRVKIGFTTNWPGRLRILKTSCPAPVSTVALIPAERDIETFLHRAFGNLRSHGEWFDELGEVKELTAALEGTPCPS